MNLFSWLNYMQEEARELTFPSVAMLFLNPDADSWDKGESAKFFSGFWPITEAPAGEARWAVSKHSLIVFAWVHFLLPVFFFSPLLARLHGLGAKFKYFSRIVNCVNVSHLEMLCCVWIYTFVWTFYFQFFFFTKKIKWQDRFIVYCCL